ncbi:MAG: biotin/lipoyl-binding protein [Thermoplasmata archaeon]|nr:biotin/lipoyl-binding protein [Thermoplasmata archaeon]
MQLALEIDGEKHVVEVDLDAGTVRVGERTYPFTLVADKNGRAELEIGGEKVVVDGWPEGLARPPGPLAIDGELRKTDVRLVSGSAPAGGTSRPSPATPDAPSLGDPAPTSAGPGTPVFPPMPGRVVEVRVQEGARVARGEVLLVLEAMKMRNDVPSPVAGTVRELRVKAGSNVRAREPMLNVVPEGSGE